MDDIVPDGLALTPFDEAFYRDPYPVYARLRAAESVHQDQQSFYPNSWTISDFETVKALLTDTRLSVDPRAIGLRRDPRADNAVTLRDPNMMNLDNPEHQRLRALVHKAFTPTSVEAFRQRITQIVETQLDDISTPDFDAVVSLSKPIPTITIAEFIGIDSRHHEDFKRWTDSLLLQGYPVPTESQWQEIVQADSQMRDYMTQTVAERTQSPQDDLVSRLIQARADEQLLTGDEIVEMCCLLIGAGNFTTTDLISNTIFASLNQSLSSSNISDFVTETLRADSPVMAVRRYVTEAVKVNGHIIESGAVVNLVLAAANHDPEFAENPDQFDSSRRANHLAFGRGIHHCLGAPLAKLETEITLECLYQRFPKLSLVNAKRSRRMDFRGFTSLVVSRE